MMYSFDEISLIPAEISTISSRSEVNPFDENGKLPIFVAPMTCILNAKNYDKFNKYVYPVLPWRENADSSYYEDPEHGWRAISLQEFEKWTAKDGTLNPYLICVDVANGHMKKLYDLVPEFKKKNPNAKIMVGNIANPETYVHCCKAKIDYVRIGIGGGSGCTTSTQTGFHSSLPWLLEEIWQNKRTIGEIESYSDEDKQTYHKLVEIWDCGGFRTKIVADGGINSIDKAIKALALGADYVMIGSMFAQCEEACGQTKISLIHDPDPLGKSSKVERLYYGQSSFEGQIDRFGKIKSHPEGLSKWVPVTTNLDRFCFQFEAVLRSAMSYANTSTLKEFTAGNIHFEYQTSAEFNAYNK